MRLLICTQVVDSADSNLGFFTRWIAEFAQGAEMVEVICLRAGAHQLPSNVRVHVLGAGSRLQRALRFYKLLGALSGRYDAVFVHMNPEYAVLGGLFWRLAGKRVGLWYAHGSVTKTLRIATLLITDAFSVTEQSFPLATAKKHALGHGIDTERFPLVQRSAQYRIRLITIGRISARKHLLEMLPVLDSLAARGRLFTLTIIGAPITIADEAYEAQLIAAVAARSYARDVHFAGAIGHEELLQHLAEADVALNFAQTGNMDKSGLEALATGLPLVATNPAFRALEGVGGVFLPPPDPSTIADTIVAAHGSDATPAAERVRAEHSLGQLVPRITRALALPTRGWALAALLVLAAALMLPTVSYGLPYHLYGDEESLVYGALLMLKLHTLIPALHTQAFAAILYEPPVLAYLYALIFAPVLGVGYLLSGTSFAAYVNAVAADPSLLWYLARLMGVLFALGNIYLTYRIARRLAGERVALWSALFLATSMLELMIAATARHWVAGTFFSLLALLLVLEAPASARPRRVLVASGIALGLSFGASYLPYFAPLIALSAFLAARKRGQYADLIWGAAAALLTAGLCIAVYPHPLYVQAFDHVIPSAAKSVGAFLGYYGSTLLYLELPLAVCALIGLGRLAHERRGILAALLAALVLTGAAMYAVLPNIARYLVPLVPLAALLAGYGASWLFARLPRSLGRVLLLLLAAYWLLLFGRYEYLVVQGDTRTAMLAYIEAHVPQGSTLLVDSETMRVPGTPAALARIAAASPTALRASDRALLAGAVTPYAANLYTLFDTASSSQAQIIAAWQHDTGPHYLLVDSWTDTGAVQALISGSTPLAQRIGSDAALGTRELVPGGNYDGGQLLLPALYRAGQLGPTTGLYELP